MNFRIQASKPKNNLKFSAEDERMSEAIETIFPMMTEEAFLIWNTIYIPLNYKYDISYMLYDILYMLKCIRQNPDDGELEICWAPDSFACDWILIWDREDISINATWRCVAGHTEELLNKSNEVTMGLMNFIYEWKMILKVVIRNLEDCGYNNNNLEDMHLIYDEFDLINEYGLLYK